jgi:hypothetical protein
MDSLIIEHKEEIYIFHKSIYLANKKNTIIIGNKLNKTCYELKKNRHIAVLDQSPRGKWERGLSRNDREINVAYSTRRLLVR